MVGQTIFILLIQIFTGLGELTAQLGSSQLLLAAVQIPIMMALVLSLRLVEFELVDSIQQELCLLPMVGSPKGVTGGSSGNIFVADDASNGLIRMISIC